MILSGIIEGSTVDWHGHLSTVFFFHDCNAVCGYCHNGEMMACPSERDYPVSEIREILTNGLGDSIVISGGEPLMHKKDVIALLEVANELGLQSMINTNGSLPDELLEILDTNLLSAISIDVKGEFAESYFNRFGINPANVKRSLEMVTLYRVPLEVRLTLCKGISDPDIDVRSVALYVKAIPCELILQQFVPSDGILDKSLSLANQPTTQEMVDLGNIARRVVKKVYIRTTDGLERIK
jgi:pyruvate formate lyase activating enzyme